MRPDTDPLAEAILTLVGITTATLAGMDQPLARLEGVEQWRVDANDPTQFVRTSPEFLAIRGPGRTALEATPEWAAAVAAFRDDQVLGLVADELVGTALGSGLVQVSSMLESVVAKALAAADPASVVGSEIAYWRATLGADPVLATTIVIVGGLNPAGDIAIAPDVVVRQMSDAEVAQALRVQAMPSIGSFGPVTFVLNRSCIAIRQQLRRVVGGTTEPEEATAIFADRERRAEAAIAALRIVGFTHLVEYARVTAHGRGSVSWGVRRPGPMVAAVEPFGEAEGARARPVFESVSRILDGQSSLAIAVRRSSGSHEPRHEEDRLLDLWIAVEALFSPKDALETTFSMALNVANTVEVPGVSRRALFDWMKRAYGTRSALVHGRSATLGRLKRLDGTPAESISAVADDLQRIVRLGIEMVLNRPLPDFVDVALGAVHRRASES